MKPPCVVVGNVTVGGTGKTPVVIALVRYLQSKGLTVGVISRGYGRATSGLLEVTRSSLVSDTGDEPMLIHRSCNVPVVVAEQRAMAYECLQDRVDVVLADDGLQHTGLRRSIEIAVVDKQRGFGNGHCLPLGPLREPAARIRTVDHIIYRGSKSQGGAYLVPQGFYQDSGQTLSLEHMLAKHPLIEVVTAIGAPQRLQADLEGLGFGVTLRAFPDHYQFNDQDFVNARHAVVVTEKDAVKLPASVQGVWVYRTQMRIPETTLTNFWTQLEALL
jgi:tetraacyldisaccharide 4'-kinase